MTQTIFLWTIAATVLAGIQLFVQKVIAHEGRDAALSGLMMYAISGALAAAVLLSLRQWPQEWIVISLFGLAAGTMHSIGNYIRIEGLKYIDTVLFFPINKVLGPLAVVIGGVWFFGDQLTLQYYIGIALSLAVPLLLLSASEHRRQNNLSLGFVFVVISTLLTSFSMLVTKEGLSHDSQIWLVLSMSQIAGTACSLGIFIKRNGLHAKSIVAINRRDVLLGLLMGVLGFLSTITLFHAVQGGLVSLVYVIHAHYILIPIVLSVLIYGEHINLRKTAAIVVSLLAIGLLYKV